MKLASQKKTLPVAVFALAVTAVCTLPAVADKPGEHPHYLHALSDLRAARAYLIHGDEQNVEGQEGTALIEINQAMGEIRRAAIDDGKDVNDHPPVDANLGHKSRLNKAIALLDKARRDLRFEEDDHAALGWRRAAISHVDNALRAAHTAVKDDYHDDHPYVNGAHPHFLHAISNLRAARALLGKPEEANVKADERKASEELTEAIRFAKQGAVDDGLNIFDNPAPSTNLSHRDRLHKALQLVHDAHYEMTHFHESNGRADSPLHQAITETNQAGKLVEKAIADDRRDDRRDNR